MDDKVESSSNGQLTQEDKKELLEEQRTEMDVKRQRTIRQDVVTRFFGNEMGLTKKAYELANENPDRPIQGRDVPQGIATLIQLKSKIVDLKVKQRDESDEQLLKDLLGAFANEIAIIKEALVMEKMSNMNKQAHNRLDTRDGSVNAKVMTKVDSEVS